MVRCLQTFGYIVYKLHELCMKMLVMELVQSTNNRQMVFVSNAVVNLNR